MIKRLIMTGALAGMAFAPVASAAELRITVWTGNDAHLEMLQGIADSFQGAHPDVTVRYDTIPFNDYVQKLTLQLAGGNPPDLGWLLESSAPTFVDAGVLADIGPALRDTEGYDFDDFSEPAMDLWVRDDAVYGIPFSTSPFLVYYNKTMFDEAGLETPDALAAKGEWTWERLKQDAATLSQPDSGVWGFESVDGAGYDSRVLHTLIPIIRAYGGDAWTDGECRLGEPEAVAAVSLYHDMVFADRSAVPPGEQGDFFTGKAAMTVTQISRVTKLDDAAFEWGIAPLPSGPSGESVVIGQAAIVVFSQSRQPDLAAEFLAHMTNADNVQTMAAFFPPARTSVLKSPAFLDSNERASADQMAIVADGIATGTVLPSHVRFPQIEAAAKPQFDGLWKADADVKAVLDDVCGAIQPLL